MMLLIYHSPVYGHANTFVLSTTIHVFDIGYYYRVTMYVFTVIMAK